MKKVSFAFSIVLMASLLLAACGGNNGVEGTPGALGTPGAFGTSDAGTIPNTGATATVDLGTLATPTAMATQPAAATATTGVVATATMAATIAPAVDLSKSPDRLDALIEYEVRSSNGDVIGEVEGVLVRRNKILSEDVLDNDVDDNVTATGTPVTGVATAAPGATQTTTGLAGDTTGVAMAGDEVLLPLSAFEPLMVGNTDLLGDDEPAMVLTVDNQILAGAPVFDRDNIDFLAVTWDEPFQAYWTGQGLTIPVTGEGDDAAASFEFVLLDEEFEGINVVNANNDDLGEVEDFIIDPTTGEFRYAVLATGGFLGIGERWIPVPMSMVYWLVDDDQVEGEDTREIDDVGEILINIPDDSFENAPAFDSLDELDTTVEGWETDIETFWQTLDNR